LTQRQPSTSRACITYQSGCVPPVGCNSLVERSLGIGEGTKKLDDDMAPPCAS